jgi:uncharacterized protein (TIGR00369 family)
MSADWTSLLPADSNGLPVQPFARTDMAMPEGYDGPVALVDPFEAFAFTSFRRKNADGTVTYALPTDERHENGRGVIHGGLLMTFADSVLGYAAWTACAPGAWCVTVSQSSTFLRGVRLGDLIEVTPVVTRATRSMIFTRGDFLVRGEAMFSAASIWKITGQATTRS